MNGEGIITKLKSSAKSLNIFTQCGIARFQKHEMLKRKQLRWSVSLIQVYTYKMDYLHLNFYLSTQLSMPLNIWCRNLHSFFSLDSKL